MILNPILKIIRDLEVINQDRDFLRYRELKIRKILAASTIAAIFVLVLGLTLDYSYDTPVAEPLLTIRLITVAILLLNLTLALTTPYLHKVRWLTYSTFYIWAISSSVIAILTGGFSSYLWGGIALVIVVWLAFIPFRYSDLILHAFIFLLQYALSLWFFEPEHPGFSRLYGSGIFLAGSLATGIIIAFVNNKASAANYTCSSALRLSDDRYRILTQNMQDVIWTLDLYRQRFTWISPSVEKLRGFTAEEVMRMNLEDSFTPDSAKKVKRMIAGVLKDFNNGVDDLSFTVGELEQTCRDGSTVWIEVAATLITNEKGELVEMLGVSRNITARRKAEIALRESEEKFRNLVSQAKDGIFIIQDERLKFVNPAFCEITGFQAGELTGKPVVDLIAPEAREAIVQTIKRRLEGADIPSIHSTTGIRKDGRKIYLELNSSTIEYEGRPAAYVIMRDTTSQMEAARKIRESEEKYRSLVEQANDGIVILQDGEVKFINQMMARILGYDVSDVVNKPFSMFIAEEERQRVLDLYRQRQQGSHPPAIYESLLVRRDGSAAPVEFNNSIITYNGRIATQTYIRDISERKQAEEQLRKVNERLTLHFRETPLAYIEWNENLEVTDWNPAAEKIFGYAKEEVLGSHAFDIIVPDSMQASIGQLLTQILGQTGGHRSSNENITKSGQTIYCNWYNTPLKDENGKVTGLASLVQDVTEQKKLEAELEKYVTNLEKNYSESKIKVQSYSLELETRKNELLRLQKENLQSQFETLRSQVNPHFLFNSLNVLTSLIKVEPDLAEKFTLGLSTVYRYILENKDRDLVSLRTELDFLKAYTFLLDIRFAGKMKVEVNIPDESMQLKIVPLALQLLIENAIKHNAFSRKQPLMVTIVMEDDYLVISNNLQIREAHVQSTGVGLNNIESRYAFFTSRKMSAQRINNRFVVKIPLLQE